MRGGARRLDRQPPSLLTHEGPDAEGDRRGEGLRLHDQWQCWVARGLRVVRAAACVSRRTESYGGGLGVLDVFQLCVFVCSSAAHVVVV